MTIMISILTALYLCCIHAAPPTNTNNTINPISLKILRSFSRKYTMWKIANLCNFDEVKYGCLRRVLNNLAPNEWISIATYCEDVKMSPRHTGSPSVRLSPPPPAPAGWAPAWRPPHLSQPAETCSPALYKAQQTLSKILGWSIIEGKRRKAR